MKKSIIAVLLAVLLLCSFSVSAESVKEYFSSFPIPESYNVTVDADIEVQRSTGSGFVDGPLNVKKNEEQKWPTFDFKAIIYMDKVRAAFKNYNAVAKALIADDSSLLEEYKNLPVSGEFIVSATYPSSLSLPVAFLETGNMTGFSDEAKVLFKEIERNEIKEGKWKTLSIKIAVKSPDGKQDYIKQGDLESNLEEYLPDFTLTCNNVTTSSFASCTVYGGLEGYTYIGGVNGTGKITTLNYTAKQLAGKGDDDTLGATIKVVSIPSDSDEDEHASSGIITFPEGANSSKNEILISFDINGETNVINAVSGKVNTSINLDTVKKPEKEGFYFDGWYADKACTQRISGLVPVQKDTVFYGKWINTTAPTVLNSEAHIAYINGYEDGTVRPEGNITREELAAIFFRLLSEKHKDTIYSNTNSFIDLDETRWSFEAISTMQNGGYIKGYPDGTFLAEKKVTRAELVTIISRFYNETEAKGNGFYDIAGHWAEDAIISAVNLGLINGYEDGTFRPENFVTRAEAISIINRMLVRYVDAETLNVTVKEWPDNSSDAWYYDAVVEATNEHLFEREQNTIYETWTSAIS